MQAARSGLCFRSDFFVIQARLSQLSKLRVGFTASKKVGNSVVRNRCKRRMRALADLVLANQRESSIDYVFIARKKTYSALWDELVTEAQKALKILEKKMKSAH